MSKKKENWLVVYDNGFTSAPMEKKKAKQSFKDDKSVRYAVHIKKEREEI